MKVLYLKHSRAQPGDTATITWGQLSLQQQERRMNAIGTEEQVAFYSTQTRGGQHFLVAGSRQEAEPAQSAYDAYSQIGRSLHRDCARIVHERIFGSVSAESEVRTARGRALRAHDVQWNHPITYIEGNPAWGKGFAGVIVHALSGESVDGLHTIYDGDIACGRAWRQHGLRWLVLQNINGQIHGAAGGDKQTHQAHNMIAGAERLLRRQGFSYRNVVRTWFYLSDILGWYGQFNDVRNARYSDYGVMPSSIDENRLPPASTGVSGENPAGTAAVMDLLAVGPDLDTSPAVACLRNKRQIDAFKYGSAFSRGAVVRRPGISMIQVSGTAAIDEKGKSLYVGDIRGQISCTFDKIESLLEPQGAGLEDICAATAFVKHPEFGETFRQTVAARGLEEFPCVCVVANICRDELLFEIDAEVVIQ